MIGFPIEEPLTEEERSEAEAAAVASAFRIGICPNCFEKWYYREPWTCKDCGVELVLVQR